MAKKPEGISLKELQEKAKEETDPSKGIKKEVSVMKANEGDADGSVSSLMRPSDEQLEKINKFTKSPKTADEVICFPTLSCNDITDRDDDQFTKETVEQFAKLPEPYSSVGKSYMLSHDYTKLPVGRIYDVGTTEVDGALFLRNEVYVPNTEQYKSFIENVDFGVFWAVSVGVMLGAQECSIDGTQMSGAWGWSWCEKGHLKGESYDPDEEETDSWGFIEAADPSDNKSVKCVRLFKEPKDFYELSQVFLGAQYFAALEKDPDFNGVIKAAGAGKSIISLTARQAKELPIPHANPKVSEARQKFATKIESNGIETWVDESSLLWEFTPQTDEVICLGKKEGSSDGESISRDSSSKRTGVEVDSEPSKADLSKGSGSGKAAEGDSGSGSGKLSGPSTQGPSLKSNKEDEENGLSKEAVLAAVVKAKLPVHFTEKVTNAEGDGLDLVLQTASDEIGNLNKQVGDLTPKAAMGEKYIESLKESAKSWYIKSMQSNSGESVDTTFVEKLLELSGDNVEIIEGLIEQYTKDAQAKFPGTVRRSVVPGEPNERQTLKEPETSEEESKDRKVKRLHG